MSINAADIMKQLFDTAEAVRNNKLPPGHARAIADLANAQIGVMKTVIDYATLVKDKQLVESAGDVFLGVQNPTSITHS